MVTAPATARGGPGLQFLLVEHDIQGPPELLRHAAQAPAPSIAAALHQPDAGDVLAADGSDQYTDSGC